MIKRESWGEGRVRSLCPPLAALPSFFSSSGLPVSRKKSERAGRGAYSLTNLVIFQRDFSGLFVDVSIISL